MSRKNKRPREATQAERVAALDALYAELPSLPCKGLCGPSCGPIEVSTAERRRIANLGVTIPRFTTAAAQRWADNEKIDTCPALIPNPFQPLGEQGRCSVYAARPMICRLWGMTESMPCEWGCQPSRVLTDAECYEFLARSTEIGGIEPDQPPAEVHRNLQKALVHPVCGPLMKRFIGGDRSVDRELQQALRDAGLTVEFE